MTDHLTAIKATIPTGDPSSKDRMEWCKAAAVAIADVCLEHSQNETKGERDITLEGNCMDASVGALHAFQHARNYLLKKATAS